MNEMNNNFKILIETIEKIRKEKFSESITQEVLIDLLNLENENIDKDTDVSYRQFVDLIEKYFKNRNLV